MRRNPYDVFESLFGSNPELQLDPFSVWMYEQKRQYLEDCPQEKQCQIDGHLVGAALERFFVWIDRKHCPHLCTTFGNCNDCGKQKVFVASGSLMRPEHKVLCHRWYDPKSS